jgi:DNA adenine methylase
MDEYGINHVDRLLEPFAGGAAVSLAFLEADIVDEVVLADLDPMIAAFWSVVFSSDNPILAERIRSTEITLDRWMELKGSDPKDRLDLAFTCIYLNRTSFSGSLARSTGPIGGQKQASKYQIGCRFNREFIAQRIEALMRFKGRVRVYNRDFRQLVAAFRAAHREKCPQWRSFWYLDPPFFHKADKLYRYSFEEEDHTALRNLLDRLDGHWLLSYDMCQEAVESFRAFPGYRVVGTRYSAASSQQVRSSATTEVIVSNFFKKNDGMPQTISIGE